MKRLYIITGAAGHLGNTLIRILLKRGEEVRGLILPGEPAWMKETVRYVEGDIRKKDSLQPLFSDIRHRDVIVIHTAGIVDISDEAPGMMQQVNVGGTKHVIELCREHQVQRLVYVSSVHAIPEHSKYAVQKEVREFSADLVVGGYAKTKAEATQAVMDAAHSGLDAVIVHPSGILGPYNGAKNYLVQLVNDYIRGKLPACVHGGYDFVDVRDVAGGCLRAAQKGRTGECYILSNRYYEVTEVLKMARSIVGGKKIPTLPLWIAKASVPLICRIARLKKRRPLYTRYSLYALTSNGRFSHDKATAELNYKPRDLYVTISDTIRWLSKYQSFAEIQ
ncbi:NAD-dependent epimerase/dehydratase family protein [Ruminococcus gauvreauii]|uniref:NAD-dependent epimerase/dehydratase family protein n=1 Tax=Ruminococcus gauvreauii TaxID=438033 RepID=A0ABY5VIB5_9FIRM|nr:NAD-dependent epimerase/dehydratase family protein [Ruminococcus gauvreauii]UWP60324.1 NAD-dependent epimerase/dehydratase family protein [Ruminococcus gauvreauii]